MNKNLKDPCFNINLININEDLCMETLGEYIQEGRGKSDLFIVFGILQNLIKNKNDYIEYLEMKFDPEGANK